MFKEVLRPAWAEIDLSCIEQNVKETKKIVGKTKIIAVIKADAYGHGAVEVSKVMLKNGVDTLAVATLSEAIELRDANVDAPIIMMSLTPEYYHGYLLDYNIIPLVSSYSETRALSSLAVKRGKTVNVLVALETGMGRVGLMYNKAGISEITGINELPNVRIKGVFSHFASADEKDKSFSFNQIDRFEHFCNKLNSIGINTSFKTFANSAAILELPNSWYDAVRPGIILYGYYPSCDINKSILKLRPAMSLKTLISHIKRVPAGTAISYGRHFVTERESTIATLPIGYADGYPRHLSCKGRVLVNGQYAPVIGSICMDQFMIDVTDIAGVKKYDEVVLIGTQGKNTITAVEIAKKANTISYEIISRIGKRVPRVYINGE